MRRAIIGVVPAVSATSAVPAHAAPVTGDQPATGTAVAAITHDPREDEAPLPAVDVTSAAMTVAASPLGLGPGDGSIPGDGVAEKPAAEANVFSAHQAGPTMTVRPRVPKVRYGLALPGGDELRTAHVDAPNNRVPAKAPEIDAGTAGSAGHFHVRHRPLRQQIAA
ncbi:MAG: hypothetical protein QOF58_5143 [Pseudonocardiales bacterium]|nr:hypothetical protein [Pseudonocardiales bacterium]